MENTPSVFSGCDQCPVENVGLDDIQTFIQKLNHITGRVYRLPTEAEWEFASKGGNLSYDSFEYSGSDYIDEVGWYKNNSEGKPHPVGKKEANELGIYDMSGNVWELVAGRWLDDYISAPSEEFDSDHGNNQRVLCGGSWAECELKCTTESRRGMMSYRDANSFGFRIACDSLENNNFDIARYEAALEKVKHLTI